MKTKLSQFKKFETTSMQQDQTFGGCSYEPTTHQGTCRVISVLPGQPDRVITDTHKDTKHIQCEGYSDVGLFPQP